MTAEPDAESKGLGLLDVAVLLAMAVIAVAFAAGLIHKSGIDVMAGAIAGAALFMLMASSHFVVMRSVRSTSVTGRINVLEEALVGLDNDLQRIDRVEDDVARLDLLNDRVERLDNALADIDGGSALAGTTRFDRLSGELERLQEKIESVRSEVESVSRAQREEIGAELKSLEGLIKAISVELGGAPSAALLDVPVDVPADLDEPKEVPFWLLEEETEADAEPLREAEEEPSREIDLEDLEDIELREETPDAGPDGQEDEQDEERVAVMVEETTFVLEEPAPAEPAGLNFAEEKPARPGLTAGESVLLNVAEELSAFGPAADDSDRSGLKAVDSVLLNAAMAEPSGFDFTAGEPLQSDPDADVPLGFDLDIEEPLLSDPDAEVPLGYDFDIEEPLLSDPDAEVPVGAEEPVAAEEPVSSDLAADEDASVLFDLGVEEPAPGGLGPEEPAIIDLGAEEPAFAPELLASLRQAVDASRIDLYLQPIVALPARKLRYCDALTRIRTEANDIIPPEIYQRAAESAGLLSRIDNVMLVKSVQLLRRLGPESKLKGVFCPLSTQSLLDHEFFPELVEFLEENSSLADSLIFQLSQQDVEDLGTEELASLKTLGKLGFCFALDKVARLDLDYDSLRDHFFRFVKIGAETIESGMEAARAPVTAADLAGLLERFDLKLIVTEVDTEESADRLDGYGVELAQGDAFAEPKLVSPATFHELEEADAA